MGAVKVDLHGKERSLDAKYHALDNADGIRLLLGDYHALSQRRYQGDVDASVILLDLATAIAKAGLTDRQRQALALVYGEDLTQEEAGRRMGISQQSAARHLTVAEAKVARVYESWARRGEGYSLSDENTTELGD